MKRKTIIYAVVDKKNKKFVVRNRNTDDFCKPFRELFSDLCEMNASLDGVALNLNDTLANDDWRFFAVFDAPNNYNRDQTEINKRKSHYRDHYLIEGYTEDPSLDNDGTSIKYNTDYVKQIKNNRNLGVLLAEKGEELQKALENQKIEYDKKTNELEKKFQKEQDEIRLKAEKFIENKRNELKKKLNEERYNYELSLNNIKDNYYSEIEKLKDEKKTLENECAEIVKLKNKRDSLTSEISFLDSSKINLEADIRELYDELNKKQSSVSSLNMQIEKLKNTYVQVNNDLTEKNKLLSAVNNKIKTIDERTRFYAKDVADLQMWENFARDYGYDKTGIRKLREDIDKLKKIMQYERD